MEYRKKRINIQNQTPHQSFHYPHQSLKFKWQLSLHLEKFLLPLPRDLRQASGRSLRLLIQKPLRQILCLIWVIPRTTPCYKHLIQFRCMLRRWSLLVSRGIALLHHPHLHPLIMVRLPREVIAGLLKTCHVPQGKQDLTYQDLYRVNLIN